MTFPSKQKSLKNILIHNDFPQSQLKISQLHTEPNFKTFFTSFNHLAQKYGTSNTQKHNFLHKITSMQTQYYNPSLIYMENQIEFYDSSEYLKRFYFLQEFSGKIKMLGQYYKYHNDHPRIFLEEVQKVMTNFQSEKRQLEYAKVKEKIEEQRLANQLQKNFSYENGMNRMDSNKNILHNHHKKTKKPQKLLKNIQLSYVDFQNKPLKKPNPHNKSKQRTISRKVSINGPIGNKERTLQKSHSSKIKPVFSTIFQHQKSRQNSKNETKRVYSLKNTESKEIKNLQSKYTQIISELFNKKRSSSKVAIDHKIEFGNNKNLQKVSKQEQIQADSHTKIHDNQSAVVKSNQNKHDQQNKKMIRSKSQATMNVCKSNKMLKTFQAKANEKTINLNHKPTANLTSKQAKQQKTADNAKEHTLKRDKYSSSKSLRQMISQKPSKAVKMFQIAKKDLIIEHSSNNNSVQKDIIKCQVKQHDKEMKPNEKNDNKENHLNEDPVPKDKKRTASLKPTKQLAHKKKEIGKKSQKQAKAISMFGRVLKSKIRG